MLLGYARVSTDNQDLALQRRTLRAVGCRKLYEEKLSGAQRNRPELARLLDQMLAILAGNKPVEQRIGLMLQLVETRGRLLHVVYSLDFWAPPHISAAAGRSGREC